MILKRVFDFFAALVLLILFAPVMLFTALIVAATMGWPVIFRQIRPGLNVKLFPLYKFRTMRNATHPDGLPLDADRLTRVGKLLRATSLDELPELFNVLRGDMSLVGPRPLLPEYLPRYTPEQARRHEALPGITGWAQVNGRNMLAWEEKFEMDVWYVDNRTFLLDLKILLLTLNKVVCREGISHIGHATMEPFMGTEKSKSIAQSEEHS